MSRFLLICLLSLLSATSHAGTITVAAAISFKDALAQVAAQYKNDTGESVEFTFGSSGQLANQIAGGAPVDLFISAAEKQVADLVKAGMVDARSRKLVAGNALVLIVPTHGDVLPKSLEELTRTSVTRIAMGQPKSVPAGQYAAQALSHAGIADAVKEKLVYGINVRQVLSYVERGEVSAGLVYATDAAVAGDKVTIAATIDAAAHDPIVYPAVLISASKQKALAERFLDYLLSDKGQASLRKFGFTPPPATDKPAK